MAAGTGALNALPLSVVPGPASPGNMLVNWMIGTQQESTELTQPFNEVGTYPSAPDSVPATAPQHFYRLRNQAGFTENPIKTRAWASCPRLFSSATARQNPSALCQ